MQEFGPEWAKEHLVPQVLAMVKNPHYLYRMTVLVAISSLANYVSQEVFVGTMLPVLVTCAKDRVPNVKFNVAKVGALKRRPFADSTLAQAHFGHTHSLHVLPASYFMGRQHTRPGTIRAQSCIACHACIQPHGAAEAAVVLSTLTSCPASRPGLWY